MIKILKPANEALKVFNPATGLPLNGNGEEVGMSSYWRRMILCGDAVEVKQDAAPVKSAQKQNQKRNVQKNNSEGLGHDNSI